MTQENPYHQPRAALVSPQARQELAVHEPVHRPAGHGLDWLADAWALFRRRPFAWLGAALSLWLVLALVNLVMAFIPLIGSIVPTVLSPVFGVGLLHLAHTMDRGEGLRIGDIFAGFRQHTGALLGLGGLFLLLGLVMAVLMMVAVFVVFGGDIAAQLKAAEGAAPNLPTLQSTMLFQGVAFALVAVTLVLLMIGTIWFAPALVYFGQVHPARALWQSLTAVLRNIPAFTVYSLALVGFWLLAMLPGLLLLAGPLAMAGGLEQASWVGLLGGGAGIAAVLVMLVGYLVVMLVGVISLYSAFRDIFIAPRQPAVPGQAEA